MIDFVVKTKKMFEKNWKPAWLQSMAVSTEKLIHLTIINSKREVNLFSMIKYIFFAFYSSNFCFLYFYERCVVLLFDGVTSATVDCIKFSDRKEVIFFTI